MFPGGRRGRQDGIPGPPDRLWTLTSGLGAFRTAGGVVLWLLELCAAVLSRPADHRTGAGDDHAVTRGGRGPRRGRCDQVVVPPRAAIAPPSMAASSSVIGADSRRRGISHSATDENTQQPMM